MRCIAPDGRPTPLAAYDRARSSVLAEELGIDPSPELRAVHDRVLRQDPTLLSVGPSVKGHRLVERVGAGAFGVVWRATQPGVDRWVAIKVAHPALAGSGDFIRRFESDARRVARIEHPHVARCTTTGETPPVRTWSCGSSAAAT